MSAARILGGALIALLVVTPAQAARPIVDLHKLDAYFALFAEDSNVPWKTTAVRLDTYSSAPVQFSVYRVDPADVLTTSASARAVDTRKMRALRRFTFTPPGGYQFQSNVVTVPLGSAQGFFVVEARRGRVGEQVWINRTRVGLVATQTPAQLFVHGVDLGTGMALSGMRVQLLVGQRFVTKFTDRDGSLRWSGSPVQFVLAQWGASYAFLNVLPQAPVPSTIVGVRTESAVVHAGGAVRAVGFARTRRGGIFVPATGDADVSLRQGARILAQSRVAIDRSGAFSVELPVPADAAAGDDAILAQTHDAVGGASVHVDADADGLTLDVASACGDECDAERDVPVIVRSSRPNVDVHVSVVRSPHVYVGYVPDTTPWGTTTWLDERVKTDDAGRAEIDIPHPTDGLASTYGVHVESGGATADTRIVVPTADVAVRVHVDGDQEQLGTAVGYDVYVSRISGGPPVHGHVVATLSHGGSMQQQVLDLGTSGHARGAFQNADLGTNLVTVTFDDGERRAEDATQFEVVAQASPDTQHADSADLAIALDRDAYRPGEPVVVRASAPGSSGEALVTMAGAFGVQAAVVRVDHGSATATLRAVDAQGEVEIGAAFVRDGALATGSIPLDIDGAGRASVVDVSLGAEARPSADVPIVLHGIRADEGTAAVRLTIGDPSGSAVFTSAPNLLAFGASTTQTSAPQGATLHPWVDSTGDHPRVLEFVRHTEPPPDLSIEQADTRAISWSVKRSVDGALLLHLPEEPGRYTLSVLDITDDGRIVAASSTVVVP